MNEPGSEVGDAVAQAAGDAIASLWEHDEDPEVVAVSVTIVALRDDAQAVHVSVGSWAGR
jgi:hypothetical protein